MKKSTKKTAILEDSFVNAFANIGTGRDKQFYSTYTRNFYTPELMETIYLTWAGGQIVDVPPLDMTREWRQFDSPSLTPEQMEDMAGAEDDLQTKDHFQAAQKWARLYGGGIIVMVVDNSGFPDEPLNPLTVGQGDLKHLNVFDKTEVVIEEIDQDPLSLNYRRPLYYRVNDSSQKIHFSRVLHFRGIQVPWHMQQNNQYWDYSIFYRTYDPIEKFDTVYNAVTSLVTEADVDIISIENLFEKLSQPNGKKALQTRFAEGALLKSINNMLLLDSRETYDRKTHSFTGLPDILTKALGVLSAAADIPATRLLGQSPGGLNATGDSDLENYYTRIHSDQNEMFSPNLNRLDEIFTRSVLGFMPDDWAYSYKPLWSMSDSEKAEIELKDSTRDRTYIESGVILPSHAAAKLKENNVYPIDDEYLEALKDMDIEEFEAEPAEPEPVVEGVEPVVEGMEPEPDVEGLLNADTD